MFDYVDFVSEGEHIYRSTIDPFVNVVTKSSTTRVQVPFRQDPIYIYTTLLLGRGRWHRAGIYVKLTVNWSTD